MNGKVTVDSKLRWGFKNTATGEINKTTRAEEKQVNMQKRKAGFCWVEIPDHFDELTQIIGQDGSILEKTQ